LSLSLFFSNAPPTTQISTLSLHDALPISMHETVLACRSASGLAAFRSPVGDCGGIVVAAIGVAFAPAVLFSSVLLSCPLLLNMYAPLLGRHDGTIRSHVGTSDRLVPCNR